MGTIPASENEYPEVLFAEGAAPGTPAAGLVKAYAKADGLLYSKDDAGAETPLSPGAHIADTTDAHDASAVSVDPTGLSVIAGTDAQTAFGELDAAVAAGGISPTVFSAKGELLGASANDTPALVTAGTVNGDVLERDSAQTSGNRFVPFCGASYSTNTAHNIVNGAAVAIVNFEDIVFDPGSDVTTGASWAYTAPEAGIYMVTAAVSFAASSGWAVGERGLLQLFKGGSLYRTLCRRDGLVGTSLIMTLWGTTLVELAATNTIDVRVAQNSGADLALDGSGTSNYIDIVRVR